MYLFRCGSLVILLATDANEVLLIWGVTWEYFGLDSGLY
jgi:hypothetical protein